MTPALLADSPTPCPVSVPVPVISSRTDYPLGVTDRWGQWLMKDGHADKLMQKFGWDFCADTLHDPRRFMELNFETSALAIRQGRLGVHTEIELSITDAGPDNYQSTVSRSLPSDDFLAAIALWQERLAPIQEAFPQSDVFLAEGVTFDGRLTINAFTPLTGDMETLVFNSPYTADGEIQALDRQLNALLIK